MGVLSSTVGAVGALGGAIYGTIKSGQYNNKARSLIQQQRDDNTAWYNIKQASDYTQRADVQAALKRQREILDEQMKRARATNKVAGGTDEALALQKKAANQSLSQTATNIAENAADYNDKIEQQYRAQDAALNQQQAQSYQQQAAEISKAASQVVNTGLGLVGQGLAETGLPVGKPAAAPDTRARINEPTPPVNVDYSIPKPKPIMNDEELAAARANNIKGKIV